MFDLETELKNLPDDPGVYIMHNSDDTVIYVGKAKILKNRVRQYFRNTDKHAPKVKAMVSNVAYFEYIVTGSELEALVLECNLIKKYRPKYNILLKDDKGYPYIKVNMQKPYPNIEVVRVLKNDGAKYFGPYMGKGTIKNNLEIIRKIYKPPTCSRKFPEDIGKGRPCINYQIKKCFAPCTGCVRKEEFRAVYAEICKFLDGNHNDMIRDMKAQMLEASDNTDYEKAAVIRDRIKAIMSLDEKQRIVNSDRQNDLDIICIDVYDSKSFIEAFFVRSGKITGRESFQIDDDDKSETLLNFIKQFYYKSQSIPPMILLNAEIEDSELIESWLGETIGHRVKIHIPKIGEKADLIRLVSKNVEQAISNYKINKLKEEERYGNARQMAALLGLVRPVKRIEAYDISNISGTNNVAGMVVFLDGKPYKKAYRKFKIKFFEGPDDYNAMREVIYRRFKNAMEEEELIDSGVLDYKEAKFLPFPDVIFVDGGKGQISAAKSILEEIEIDIPVYGMIKNDKHKTRGLISDEGELEISMNSSLFNFVTRIQDEVHRFAITYHRDLREKSAIKSVLDDIVGVGEKKRSILLNHFKTVENISKATFEELIESGIDKRTAENITEYFSS